MLPETAILLTVFRLLLTVVIFVVFATPALLPETAILLTVVILDPFATPALLPDTAILLIVFNELLIDNTAPLFGIFVNPLPSPINLE